MSAEHDDWINWLASDEGQRFSEPFMFEPHADYLRNRLWRAFMAGQQSGKRIGMQRVAENFRKIIES